VLLLHRYVFFCAISVYICLILAEFVTTARYSLYAKSGRCGGLGHRSRIRILWILIFFNSWILLNFKNAHWILLWNSIFGLENLQSHFFTDSQSQKHSTVTSQTQMIVTRSQHQQLTEHCSHSTVVLTNYWILVNFKISSNSWILLNFKGPATEFSISMDWGPWPQGIVGLTGPH